MLLQAVSAARQLYLGDLPTTCADEQPWAVPGSDAQCGGHGTCMPSGLCACDAGWTGRSDIVNTEGLDCTINIWAVKALWIFLAAAVVVTQAQTFKSNQRRWKRHWEMHEQKTRSGRAHPLRSNSGLMAVLSFSCICAPGMLIMAALRVFDDDSRVGLTWPATIGFILVRWGFYLMVSYFQPALLATFLKGSKRNRARIDSLVRVSSVFATVNLVLSTGFGLIPLVTVVRDSGADYVAVNVYQAYLGCVAASLMLLIGQALYIAYKANELLKPMPGSTPDEMIETIRKRIVATQMHGATQGMIQVGLHLALVLWPFMFNKHDYFNPVAWLAFVFLAKRVATTTVSGSGQTGSKSGGKSSGGSKEDGSKSGSKDPHDNTDSKSRFNSSFKERSSYQQGSGSVVAPPSHELLDVSTLPRAPTGKPPKSPATPLAQSAASFERKLSTIKAESQIEASYADSDPDEV